MAPDTGRRRIRHAVTAHRIPADAGLPQFMTVDEIAAALRVSRATVYRLVRSGALAATDVGRSVRVTRQAVDEFLHRQARRPADPPAELP